MDIWQAGFGFTVNHTEVLYRRLRQIILPAFIPGPLSPPFNLPISCALEREGVDSRLALLLYIYIYTVKNGVFYLHPPPAV